MANAAKRKGDKCACGCGYWPAKRGAMYVRGHRPPKSLSDRFWPKVAGAMESGGCWEWQGSIGTNGYGQMSQPGTRKLIPAHRASWIIHFGAIPNNLWVLHRCDNKRCVHPAHLFLGTLQDNVDDAVAKGIIKATRAKGERSGNAKLTDAQVAEIRRRHNPGLHPARKTGGSSLELAREFGVTKQYIWQLVRGHWRAPVG